MVENGVLWMTEHQPFVFYVECRVGELQVGELRMYCSSPDLVLTPRMVKGVTEVMASGPPCACDCGWR